MFDSVILAPKIVRAQKAGLLDRPTDSCIILRITSVSHNIRILLGEHDELRRASGPEGLGLPRDGRRIGLFAVWSHAIFGHSIDR